MNGDTCFCTTNANGSHVQLTGCIFPQCLFHNTTPRFLDINEIMIVSYTLLCSLKNLNAEPETFQLNCILLDTEVLSTAHCRVFWRGQNVVVIYVIILYKMHDVSSLNDLEEKVKQHQKFWVFLLLYDQSKWEAELCSEQRGTQAYYPITWVSLC